jgi:hypothetical protein
VSERKIAPYAFWVRSFAPSVGGIARGRIGTHGLSLGISPTPGDEISVVFLPCCVSWAEETVTTLYCGCLWSISQEEEFRCRVGFAIWAGERGRDDHGFSGEGMETGGCVCWEEGRVTGGCGCVCYHGYVCCLALRAGVCMDYGSCIAPVEGEMPKVDVCEALAAMESAGPDCFPSCCGISWVGQETAHGTEAVTRTMHRRRKMTRISHSLLLLISLSSSS